MPQQHPRQFPTSSGAREIDGRTGRCAARGYRSSTRLCWYLCCILCRRCLNTSRRRRCCPRCTTATASAQQEGCQRRVQLCKGCKVWLFISVLAAGVDARVAAARHRPPRLSCRRWVCRWRCRRPCWGLLRASSTLLLLLLLLLLLFFRLQASQRRLCILKCRLQLRLQLQKAETTEQASLSRVGVMLHMFPNRQAAAAHVTHATTSRRRRAAHQPL